VKLLLWRFSVMVDVASTAGGQAALLSTVQSNTVRMISTSEQFSETWQLIFERFPGASNERTRRLLAARHAGFLTDADVFGPNEITDDPLYADILVPRGYGSGVATAIPFPNGDAVVINIERAAALGPFGAAVIEHLDHLRPHLARSALISARISFERARTAVETLSALGLAACAVGRSGLVLLGNQEFGKETDLWTTRRGNRIALLDRRADRQFHDALGVIATEKGVRSLPLVAQNGGSPAVLHVVPIRRTAHDLFMQASAILVLTKASEVPTQATSLLQALLDFSPFRWTGPACFDDRRNIRSGYGVRFRNDVKRHSASQPTLEPTS